LDQRSNRAPQDAESGETINAVFVTAHGKETT
jgi:hypothetical protein